jgi:hypothetical protein
LIAGCYGGHAMYVRFARSLLARRVSLNAAVALALLAGAYWLMAPASAQFSIGIGGGGLGIGMSTDAAPPARESAPQQRPRKSKSERSRKEAKKSSEDSAPRKPAADETSFGK